MAELVEWLHGLHPIIQYSALFLLSIAPYIDVSIVVPTGILLELSPIPVMIVGFLGNWIFILLVALFFEQISRWREKRKQKKTSTTPSKKETRARKIWEKYGIPGLALVAPVIVGVDIAALITLGFGVSRSRVLLWLTASLALWTVIFGVSFMYGVRFFT